jgi:hypothetical protein
MDYLTITAHNMVLPKAGLTQTTEQTELIQH